MHTPSYTQHIYIQGAKDYRADPDLYQQCKADAQQLCSSVEPGEGRVQACLVCSGDIYMSQPKHPIVAQFNRPCWYTQHFPYFTHAHTRFPHTHFPPHLLHPQHLHPPTHSVITVHSCHGSVKRSSSAKRWRTQMTFDCLCVSCASAWVTSKSTALMYNLVCVCLASLV